MNNHFYQFLKLKLTKKVVLSNVDVEIARLSGD